MRGRTFAGALLMMVAGQSLAQTAPAPAASSVKNLSAVVVSGELPGPGMWKVSKGDHVLWILGTLTPLPKKMQWKSRQVTETELASQAVLLPPGIEMNAKIGFFGKLMLLPRLIGIRDNPDGKKLVDVLPPPVYARWLALKAQYLGRDHGVEKHRPMFAAFELYDAAVKQAGLSDTDVAEKLVNKLAKSHDIPLVSTAYQMTVANPKQAITEFRNGNMDDTACLVQVMDRVEHGLPQMQANANAWATGDIDTLTRTSFDHAGHACEDALGGADFARKQGLQGLPAKIAQSWVAAAGKALSAHRSTLATLSMRDMLGPNGYLARLQAQGYTVMSPDDQDAAAEESSDAPASASSVAR